jgi:mRNA-degrading endonuclease toxin of MazEF toxin-antitoxin module
MTPPEARLGEVWFADVPGDKRRPVLVLSRVPGSRRIVTTYPEPACWHPCARAGAAEGW